MWFDRLVQSLAWLSHVAGAPVMHGDIAPDNVMFLPDDQPVLVDFSSARLLDGECPIPPTMFSGTVSYAAPECLTAAPCPESDLFSLAMTFLSVMSGVPGKRLTEGFGGNFDGLNRLFRRNYAVAFRRIQKCEEHPSTHRGHRSSMACPL